jgi:iron complex outermembrane receptor protein
MKTWTFLVVTGMVCAQTPPSAPATAAPSGPQQQQSIIVTGVATPAPLDEADRDVSVLPLPESQRPLFNSWFNLLQLDAAMDLQQRAPGGFLADVSIRGATFGQTLVLLNDMRISDVQTGHFNLDLPIPLEMLSSVEILKGSGSTLYGSDAIGGVVNARTEPREAPDVRLYTALGNFGTDQEHAIAVFGGPRFSEELSAARDFSKGFTFNRDYRNLSFGSLTTAKSALGATSLLLAYSDKPYGADQFYAPYPSWERIKTWFLSAHQNFGSKTEANFAFRRHSDLFVLYRYEPQRYPANRHLADDWQGSLRRHDNLPYHATLSYGVEGLSGSIDSTNLGIRSRTRGSAYAVYELRFAKRYSISAGIREEVYGARQVATSPSVSGAVWLNSRIKLRASASRAFRLPTFTELYYSDPATLGNPNLKPESAVSFEGGADGYFGRKVHTALTIFHRRDSNEIDYVRPNSLAKWQAANFDELHFTGVEASADYTPVTGQNFGVAFTGLHGVSANPGVLLSKYTFNYPVQSAVLQWNGAIGRHIVARTRLGVVNRLAHDPYAVWDASASYITGRIRPFLQLTNLTNTTYEEIPAIVMPSRGVVGGIEWVLAGPHH